jgi:hypothetical protein
MMVSFATAAPLCVLSNTESKDISDTFREIRIIGTWTSVAERLVVGKDIESEWVGPVM